MIEFLKISKKYRKEILSGFISCNRFVSSNHRYSSKQNSKDYADEARMIEDSLESSTLVRNCLHEGKYYLKLVFFVSNVGDLDNKLKNPIDVISNYLGFDDSNIHEIYTKNILIPELAEVEQEYAYFEIGNLSNSKFSLDNLWDFMEEVWENKL